MLHQRALWYARDRSFGALLLTITNRLQLFDVLLNAPCDLGESAAQLGAQQRALEQYLSANVHKSKAIKPALCRQQIMLYESSQQQQTFK